MTPTKLWDIYYHAMKKWLPGRTDKEVREAVDRLMDVSGKVLIETARQTAVSEEKIKTAARKGVRHETSS